MPTAAHLSSSSTKPQQLLLRLPDELAQRFAQIVPARQRSRFLLNLLRNELDRESLALAHAAKTLTALEAGHMLLDQETTEWIGARLASSEDSDFDAEVFEREFALAQSQGSIQGQAGMPNA